MKRSVVKAAVVGLSMLCATAMVQAQGNVEYGKREYQSNCAACHGTEGRGNGPYNMFMTQKSVPDLAVLARNSDGGFPYQRVQQMIDGREQSALGETRDMPIWGARYAAVPTYNPELYAALRIAALIEYVEQLQVK